MSYGAVYKITNINDDKCYIGATTRPKTRWNNHKKKFNPKDHIFEILAEYDTIEELNEGEIFWIDFYDSIVNGYNKMKGGSIRGKKGGGFVLNKVSFPDYVKINGETFYFTIPIEIARNLNLKKHDFVKINITKMETKND